MDSLKEVLQKSLQVKKTLLLDAYPGLCKMGEKLWQALESRKGLFFLGEQTSHTLAHFVAEEIRQAVSSLKGRIYCPMPPQILSSSEVRQWTLAFLEAHFQKGDFLVLFAEQGRSTYVLEVAKRVQKLGGHLLLIAAQGHKIPKNWIHWGLAVPTARSEEVWEIHLIVGNFFLTYLRQKLTQNNALDHQDTRSSPALEIPSKVNPPTEEEERFIRFTCSKCEDVIFTERRFSGKEGVCPSCGETLIVPETSTLAPGERAGEDKRLHMRFQVQDCLVAFHPTRYPDTVSELIPHAILDDLSEGGCAFVLDPRELDATPLAVGKKVYLLISIPAFNKPLRFRGEVKRRQKLKGKRLKVAVQFGRLSAENREKLRKLATSDILRNLRRGRSLF